MLRKKILSILLLCVPLYSNAGQILFQPLAETLPAKIGTRQVTDDWLVTLPIHNFDARKIEWLDNMHLIYALNPVDSTQSIKIETVNIQTGAHRFLCAGEIPKPSPDGQWIVFVKGKPNERQLWLMKKDGTQLKQLTHVAGGLGVYKYNFDLSWSSDSKHIAMSRLLAPFKSAIELIDLPETTFKRILTIDAFQLRSLAWSPDGKDLLFWKEQAEDPADHRKDIESIQAIHLSDGRIRTLAQFNGLQQSLDPAISPDGQQIAIVYDSQHPYFDTTQDLGLIDMKSYSSNALPSIKQLTYETKLISPQWSRDGQSLYAVRIYGAYNQIYSINVKTGKLKQITHSPYSISSQSYSLSPDGTKLAWAAMNAHATNVIRVANSDGENVRDLVTLTGVPDEMSLSEVREIEWDTLNYPTRMRGLLMLPLNYHAGNRYPLVVDIHGGGSSAPLILAGGILATTALEWQMWTAKGYAVFIPEFRSSGAFGSLADTRDFLQNHDILNCDIIDVETGVDALIASGIVDSQRMAVIGYSAGGRRVNWLTVTRHPFKALISKEGWADEWLEALKPGKHYPIERISHLYGGLPQQAPQHYLKNSALSHAYGASAPTLFLMGNPDLGGADRIGTVKLLYNAIKAKGIETQYVSYPDEGHDFEKPTNRLDALTRCEKWIETHTRKD